MASQIFRKLHYRAEWQNAEKMRMISYPISTKKTLPFFTDENKELEAFKAEKTGSDFGLLQPWEVGYWAEKLKKERYDFDDEDLVHISPFNQCSMECLTWSQEFLG